MLVVISHARFPPQPQASQMTRIMPSIIEGTQQRRAINGNVPVCFLKTYDFTSIVLMATIGKMHVINSTEAHTHPAKTVSPDEKMTIPILRKTEYDQRDRLHFLLYITRPALQATHIYHPHPPLTHSCLKRAIY